MSHIGGDYAIWLVVAVPTGRRREAGSLAPVLAGRDGAPAVRAGAERRRFHAGCKVVAFAPLVRPHRAVFVVRWATDGGGRRPAGTLSRFSDVTAGLFGLRVVVLWTSLWLFVGGPGLTFWLGSTAAIYCTIAAVYPFVLVAGVVLWRGRHRLRLSGVRIVKLTAEALVCPPTLPNLLRKVTMAEPVAVDGVQIALAVVEPDGREPFLERLDSHAQELVNEMGGDEPEGQRLLAYLTTARAAR